MYSASLENFSDLQGLTNFHWSEFIMFNAWKCLGHKDENIVMIIL